MKRKLEWKLFADDCPVRNRFINPKFLEFYLFGGMNADQALEALRCHQHKLAMHAATPKHLECLSVINSGNGNPSSIAATMARTGESEASVRGRFRHKSSGTSNGFHGHTHTDEVKRHLAKKRAEQSKLYPILN